MITDELLPFAGRLWVQGFKKCLHGHAAILDAIEVAVIQFRHYGGEYGLDAPTALLTGVVVAFPCNRQQVNYACVDGQQCLAIFRGIARPVR